MGPILPYIEEDDLVERARTTGSALVRVYRPSAVAAVIGRGGDAARELHESALDADGVHVFRRPGGGCAVVLDPGNLVVVLALPVPGIGGITGAFRAATALMIDALAECGVPGVEHRGVSDLAWGGRKLGGSCIHRQRNLVHYATTLLVDPDLELLERYLPHPPREPEYRAGRRHGDFVTTLRRLGFEISMPGLSDALERRLPDALRSMASS